MTQRLDTLAQRVKFARDQRKLTQVKLAEVSGLKQSDISKIEQGKILKTTGLIALSRALACSADWLDTGEPPWDQQEGGDDTPKPSPEPRAANAPVPLRPHGANHSHSIAQLAMMLANSVAELDPPTREAIGGFFKHVAIHPDEAQKVSARLTGLLGDLDNSGHAHPTPRLGNGGGGS